MLATTIIILITFVLELIDKASKKPIEERHWILRKIEGKTLWLLGGLLVFQLIDVIYTRSQEQKAEVRAQTSYDKILSTADKLEAYDATLSDILNKSKTAVDYAESEIGSINDLNFSMKGLRGNIEGNIYEYKKLNDQYSRQLQIEREKIANAMPDIKVMFPKTFVDSINFRYQFFITNYGNRLADSIKYYSAFILINSNGNYAQIDLIKSNHTNANILSIPPGIDYDYIVNSEDIRRNTINQFKFGVLLIKIQYKDNMLNTLNKLPTYYYSTDDLSKNNKQLGQGAEEQDVLLIKDFLLRLKHPSYHIFFE
jgi:hypothetical protein